MSSIKAQVDYTSKDYDGLKASLLDYAGTVLPEWTTRSEGDFGVALVELLAYEGDILSYYGDRIQDEAFIGTATQRSSLLQIASLLGYIPSNGVAATGTVTLMTSNPGPAVSVPVGTVLTTDYSDEVDGPIAYETTAAVTVPANGGTATVSVAHGVTRPRVALGTSDGRPNQSYRLPERGILTDTIRVFVDTAAGVATEEWSQIDFLVDGDPDSKVFAVRVDSNGEAYIEFGDGLNGAYPTNGLNVSTTYRVGGGAVGNVAAGLITSVEADGLAGPVYVAQDAGGGFLSSEMSGGSDAESNDQIRANAPRAFRTQNRLVTLQDFSDAALAVPGVLRANAIAGSFSSVTVYVVGPDGGQPGPALIESVQKALQEKVLAGVTVSVGSPAFVPVNVGSSGSPLVVKVYDGMRQATVGVAVNRAVKEMLSFAKSDFGRRFTVADFYWAIMSVPGVQSVSIPMVARADSAQTGTADIVCREWEIAKLGDYYANLTGGIV